MDGFLTRCVPFIEAVAATDRFEIFGRHGGEKAVDNAGDFLVFEDVCDVSGGDGCEFFVGALQGFVVEGHRFDHLVRQSPESEQVCADLGARACLCVARRQVARRRCPILRVGDKIIRVGRA